MRVYLASNYHNQDLCRQIREDIRPIGVTSRWLYNDESQAFVTEYNQAKETNSIIDQASLFAYGDLEDIRRADVFVLINTNSVKVNRGGKCVETGYALGLGKPFILVGRRINVFDTLAIVQVPELTDLRAVLMYMSANYGA